MGCSHGRQRKCKFFHRWAPPSRKTMTKKKILALSQPPSQHTCQPSICWPTATGRGKRRNLVSSSMGSHLCLWSGCTVKPRKRSTASTDARGDEAEFTTMPEEDIALLDAPKLHQ